MRAEIRAMMRAGALLLASVSIAQSPPATGPAMSAPAVRFLTPYQEGLAVGLEQSITELRRRGQFVEATSIAERRLAVLSDGLGASNGQTVVARHTLASARRAAGLPVAARLIVRQAEQLEAVGAAAGQTGRWQDAAALFESAAQAFAAAGAEYDAAVALGLAGGARLPGGQLDMADALFEAGGQLFTKQGVDAYSALYTSWRARIRLGKGSLGPASELFDEAADGFWRAEDPGNSNICRFQSRAARDNDLTLRLRAARKAAAYTTALPLARELLAHREGWRGALHGATAMARVELSRIEHVASLPAELQQRQSEADEAFAAAWDHLQRGQGAAARAEFERCETAAVAAGDDLTAVRASGLAAVAWAGQEPSDAAENALAAALERVRKFAYDPAVATFSESLGRCRIQRQRHAAALEAFEIARAANERMGHVVATGNNWVAEADALTAMGRQSDAYRACMHAVRCYVREGDDNVQFMLGEVPDRSVLVDQATKALDAGRLDEAERAIRVALNRRDVQQDALTYIAMSMQLETLHLRRGNLLEAQRCVADQVRVQRGLVETGGPRNCLYLGLTLEHFARNLLFPEAGTGAAEFFTLARSAYESGGRKREVALCDENLGDFMLGEKHLAEALEAYERAVAGLSEAAGPESADFAQCLERIGYDLQGVDDAAARQYLKRSAELRRKIGVPDAQTAETAEHLAEVAGVLVPLNLPRDARDYAERAIALYESLKVGDTDEYAGALIAAGFGHACTANMALALDRVDRALPMLRRLGNEEATVLRVLNVCGLALVMGGRPAEALQRIERMLDALRSAGQANTGDYAVGLLISGAALGMLGQVEQAEERYRQALEVECLSITERATLQFAVSAFRAGMREDADAMQAFADAASTAKALNLTAVGAAGSTTATLRACWDLVNGRYAEALRGMDEALLAAPELETDAPLMLALMRLGKAEALLQLGRADEAKPLIDAALPELERTGTPLYLATARRVVALHLLKVGRTDEAIRVLEEAVTLVEQVRASNSAASEVERGALSRMLFLNRVFELMVRAQLAAGRPGEALRYVERGRARGLLDLLERSRFDPLTEIQDRARRQNDTALLRHIDRLEKAQRDARVEVALLEHQIALRRGAPADGESGQAARTADLDRLYKQQREAREHEQTANRDWFALVSNDLPLSQARDAAEIQQLLAPGESLIVYLITSDDGLLLLVPPPGGAIQPFPLTWPDGGPVTSATLKATVDEYLRAMMLGGQRAQLGALAAHIKQLESQPATTPGVAAELGEARTAMETLDRGLARDADGAPSTQATDAAAIGNRLMRGIMPAAVWAEIRKAPRIYLVPHGALHRLPLETVIVESTGEPGPLYWLDVGPPIVYGSSGSALLRAHERREQQRSTKGSKPPFEAVAIGDPIFSRAAPTTAPATLPSAGVYVVSVAPDAPANGLLRGDVLLRYDGQLLADHAALRAATRAVQDAVEAGTRPDDAVELVVWRDGGERMVRVPAGELGVRVARLGAADAATAVAAGTFDLKSMSVERGGLATRYGGLEPLPGTRREVASIFRTLSGREITEERSTATTADGTGGSAVLALLGDRATEGDVYEAAPQARFLHFATHQLADETESASYSSLALTLPREPSPADNGFLTLQELLDGWRNHLNGCELVVLSACETQRGREQQDDAVFAMPIGFLYAGAPAVIASLWQVNDASTSDLMSDFYARLKGGADDKLTAFTAARKALRVRFPEPYYWAPFIYIGDPR